MTASDFHGKPVVPDSVKHLDADVVVEVLSRHGVNVSEAAVRTRRRVRGSAPSAVGSSSTRWTPRRRSRSGDSIWLSATFTRRSSRVTGVSG